MGSKTDLTFRQALGEFPTGVAIVTAKAPDGASIGLTMSSFNSVSIDPPLVLFSVARRAKSVSAILVAKGFVINILSCDQERLSDQFAQALSDKWAAVPRSDGYAGAPLLDEALAHFECAPYANYDGGDHIIFVVRVVRYSVRPEKGDPLVFFRGRYRNIASGLEREPAWPLSIHY